MRGRGKSGGEKEEGGERRSEMRVERAIWADGGRETGVVRRVEDETDQERQTGQSEARQDRDRKPKTGGKET